MSPTEILLAALIVYLIGGIALYLLVEPKEPRQ